MLKNLSEQDIKLLNSGEEVPGEKLQSYYFPMSTLQKATGLVGATFYIGKYNQQEIADLENIPVEQVYDFFNCTHRKVKRYIEESLKDLKNKRLVTYAETKKIDLAYVSEITSDNIKQAVMQGESEIQATYSTIYANYDQLAFIADCEREVMRDYGLTTYNQIYHKSGETRKQFFADCYACIKARASVSKYKDIQQLQHLSKYSKSYQIAFSPRWIQEELNRVGGAISKKENNYLMLLNSVDLKDLEDLPLGEDIRQFVNTKNIHSVKGNISNRSNRAKPNSVRASKDYVTNSNKLVDNYVSMDCGETKAKLKEHGIGKSKKTTKIKIEVE